MLPEIPRSLKILLGYGCTSLKRITNLPNLDSSCCMSLDLDLWYCGKIVDVASLLNTLPLRSFDIKLLQDINLFNLMSKYSVEVQGNNHCASSGRRRLFQGLYECGIFSIFVHESKIPDQFNYRNMGNTVFSIIVPSHLNIKILGLKVCVLYARQSDRSPEIARGHDHHSLELRNETKGLKWNCSTINEVEWKVMNEDMLWLSHWIMGNNELECGEKVCFEIKEQDGFLTKEIGVQFVYEHQNKDKEDVPTTRPGGVGGREIETGVQCIHNRNKKVISTLAEYHCCNSEVFDLENESHIDIRHLRAMTRTINLLARS